MLEEYIRLNMFFEYQLPFVITCIVLVIFILKWVITWFVCSWDKRQKKNIDKYFKNEDEEK